MKNNNLISTPIIESPFFENLKDFIPKNYLDLAENFYKNGYIILDFQDTKFEEKSEKIKKNLRNKFNLDSWLEKGWREGEGLRIIDEWQHNEEIKSIAINEYILDILSALYGRPAFPFQTLNFPVGTQQNFHSDTFHFNSLPERWMCGVWVALEDVDSENGPLVYYPGSHKWPILHWEHLGLDLSLISNPSQNHFNKLWEDEVHLSQVEPVYLNCKKGQCLIWAANLLHGGAKHINPARTRWSQVTHYYFEDCTYWRPYASQMSSGNMFTFNPPNILTGRKYSLSMNLQGKLPKDFKSVAYLKFNPDLQGMSDAHLQEHYILYGSKEGRKYI